MFLNINKSQLVTHQLAINQIENVRLCNILCKESGNAELRCISTYLRKITCGNFNLLRKFFKLLFSSSFILKLWLY